MSDLLEYVSVSCPTLNGKAFLEKFLPALPEEFFCCTENDAELQLKSRMISLLGSEALFEELEKDCHLENLYVDDEFHTLDELLHVVPDRTNQRLKSLKTLEALPKGRAEKDVEKHALGIRGRFRRPLIDMGYLNSPDGCFDCGFPIQDVVLTVFVYRPIAFKETDCSNAPWTMVMEQRIEILGSQTLSNLRDAIKCPQDMVYLGDCSEALDQPDFHIPARAMYPSSYFFIEDTFYDDLRDPRATRLSTCVIDWQNNRTEWIKDHYSASTMDERVLGDLNLILGKPYLFLHQGNCEHAIIFTTARLTDRTCAQSVYAYPKCTGRAPQKRLSCEACNCLRAQWLVHEAGDILPKDPTMLCIVCLRYLLYTSNGEKIHPRFRVQKFFGYEFCR
ncbi:unnamed protein product [Mesocestoides corti]|uniref:snRNA-activating protein complex subunit 3 n=1 Tax=Mesocestoides corti TaxID=53468 RepID=A0A0R3UEJ1_MESCO|nr:unnamed protein product [Mesocestoides corti]